MSYLQPQDPPLPSLQVLHSVSALSTCKCHSAVLVSSVGKNSASLNKGANNASCECHSQVVKSVHPKTKQARARLENPLEWLCLLTT